MNCPTCNVTLQISERQGVEIDQHRRVRFFRLWSPGRERRTGGGR
jgi:Zn-finger nucleic acid-binding protein